MTTSTDCLLTYYKLYDLFYGVDKKTENYYKNISICLLLEEIVSKMTLDLDLLKNIFCAPNFNVEDVFKKLIKSNIITYEELNDKLNSEILKLL